MLIFIVLSTIAPFVSSTRPIDQNLLNDPKPSSLNPFLGTTWYVGGSGPNNYTKIQYAVDNASDGDTIFVYHKIYFEHVILNKKVHLIGEVRNQTFIDGNGTGNVIKIQADGVTVEQFTLRNGGIGIYIVHSSNHTITQNSITNNWEGIGLLDSSQSIITDNTITHNGFEGINPVQTTFTIISDNTIIDHLQGIYLVESTGNTIVGNNFQGNSRGIELQQSSNENHIFHNNFFASEQNNAYDTCSNNWDDGYPSGGNYWDDYHGSDANHDGIGDTAYTIPGGTNRDHYPLMVRWNAPPSQPSDPEPINGATNVPVNPVLSVFVSDPDGDMMNISFYDAATQQRIGINVHVVSSTRASVPWNGLQNETQYHWYAIANDGSRTNQSETWEFATGNGVNQPPATPTISGPLIGKIGNTYNYTFTTTDPEGSNVFYYIDWGDATNSSWIGPYQSGEQILVSHTWTKRGIYTVKAKAKDLYGAESDWGSQKIIMPSDTIQTPLRLIQFFERLFERFPHTFPIIRLILGHSGRS